jgi:pyruvate/2-oxoacid:ferredoxin oxidoreductase alpha subunit
LTSFAAHSLRVLRRLLQRRTAAPAPHAGVETVLDGLSAVACTEAAVSDTAGLGATWPAAAGGRAWDRQRMQQRLNRLGEVLTAIEAEHPPQAIAAAIGAAIAGQRATAFISGPDLLAAVDHLALASGRHAPLVCHLATRAPAGHAQPLGSGHEAYHAAADWGWLLLFATNVQEAVDLALVARRVAERALVPAMIAMDSEQTALAVQDVRLPDDEIVRDLLGETHAVIETPTDAQRFVFGETRRLVPRLFDLDRPLLLGPLAGPESWPLGAAARRPYFDEHVARFLDEAMATFAEQTGRRYGSLHEHRLDGAEIVLVAQGAAVETACVAADAAREREKAKVGVLGIRALRPFPRERIAKALAGARVVAVLERIDTPLAGDGPLTRELRAALEGRARIVNVPFGLGGLPLRGGDLLALVGELKDPKRPRIYLGLELARARSVFPKQQALLDALHRTHPQLRTLGLRSADEPCDLAPPDAITIAVKRRAGREHETLAGEIATMLHDELGGHVRSRPALTWQRFDEPCTDIVIHSKEPLRDPGDDPAIDLVVSPDDEPRDELFARVLECARTAPDERPKAEWPAPEPSEVTVPPALRDAAPSDDTVHSLARFWDHTGVLYRAGKTDELAADPCLTAGAVPARSSMIRSTSVETLPVFDPPTLGDADPALWMSDPDGAVAARVISTRALLDCGIALAGADPLRAIAGKLAKQADTLLKSSDDPPRTAGALFHGAFDVVTEKMEAERRTTLSEALGAVVDEVGELPVARTRAFPGELFTLAVNPDACKSPQIALAACEGRGLRSEAPTPERPEASRRLWALWQRLPDTSGETIERARTNPAIGTLPALMLSRQCAHAMAGGDGAEAGSGARLALARVLAVAEFHEQPRIQKHLGEIETLRSSLAEHIRETLAAALPTSDLDALAEGLDVLGRGDVDLAALSSKIDTAVTEAQVDGARLGRLVDVARGLADLRYLLVEGPDGFGRARAGLAIAPGAVATWAGAFPFNPFQIPVLVGSGPGSGHLARGLLEGQLRQALAGLRLMRWAKLELERPQEAARAAETLAGLRYEDLTAEERWLCPPIFWVGDDQALGGGDVGELVAILTSGWPVKVVCLADAGGGADAGLAVDAFGSFPSGGRRDLCLLGALARRAYVVQTSLAHHEHFARGVAGALAHDGPALIIVHAPSPQRHGFAIERLHEQARLAVATRAVPLVRFDPAAGGVFGSCFDLEGNPEETDLTPVDWAATEERFAEHLAPLSDDDPAPTPIAEFLKLDPPARTGKTPVVTMGDKRLRVGAVLVADADERLRRWRTLQELAGVVTPFTAKVREDAERELAAAHEAEIARVRREYEERIADLRRQAHAEATQRITERLMTLAGRSRS